jgi:hypothetical protein
LIVQAAPERIGDRGQVASGNFKKDFSRANYYANESAKITAAITPQTLAKNERRGKTRGNRGRGAAARRAILCINPECINLWKYLKFRSLCSNEASQRSQAGFVT